LKCLKVALWALLSAVFAMVVAVGLLWLLAAPVTTGTTAMVDGVIVYQESSSDYTQLIAPGLMVLVGLAGLVPTVLSLKRAAAS